MLRGCSVQFDGNRDDYLTVEVFTGAAAGNDAATEAGNQLYGVPLFGEPRWLLACHTHSEQTVDSGISGLAEWETVGPAPPPDTVFSDRTV